MTILNILEVGKDADTLANRTVDLTRSDILSGKIQTLIEDMKDTCHDAEGLGLAANQVGSDANLCVYKEPGVSGFQVLANPTIIEAKEKFKSKGEGCLSLPDRRFIVSRFKRIVVSGLNEKGEPVELRTKSKQLARILQHEIDHLQGITVLDKGKEM